METDKLNDTGNNRNNDDERDSRLNPDIPPVESVSSSSASTESSSKCAALLKRMRKSCSKRLLQKRLPIIKWAPKYRFTDFQGDLIAGLTVGMTVIPQGLAYGQVAELPKVYGLYSAFMGCFIYCFLGTAKDITMGPTALMALLTSEYGRSPIEEDPTYAILLCLFSGIIQLLMGILQLGIVVNFISVPVINAFTSAAAIIIATGQLKYVFGLKKVRKQFFFSLYDLLSQIFVKTNVWDLLCGVISITILVLMRQLREIKWGDGETPITKSQRVARKTIWLFSIGRNAVVVVCATLVSYALRVKNIDSLSITGHSPAGLPPFKAPSFEINSNNVTRTTGQVFSDIGEGFLVIPILALVEAIAISKAFAKKGNYRVDPTQEMYAIGIANVVGSFVSSFPITGSFSRTAVNAQSGVRTPAGGIITGLLVIIALLVLTPAFYYIPTSALAAVIICAVLQMVDIKIFRHVWKLKKLDLIPLCGTLLFSFLFGIEYGVLMGVFLSIVMLLYPTARPKLKVTDDEFLIFELSQGFVYPAAEYVADAIAKRARTDVKGVGLSGIIDCNMISNLDYTTLRAIEEIIEQALKTNAVVCFTNLKPSLLSMVDRIGLKDFVHFETNSEAAAYLREATATAPKLAEAEPINTGDQKLDKCDSPLENAISNPA